MRMNSFHNSSGDLFLTDPRAALVGTAVLLFLTYIAYQLLWHPIARFPGPRLAALSSVWRFVHQEDMAKLLPRLHEQYSKYAQHNISFHGTASYHADL
jgi:hypothetical protein